MRMHACVRGEDACVLHLSINLCVRTQGNGGVDWTRCEKAMKAAGMHWCVREETVQVCIHTHRMYLTEGAHACWKGND